MKKTNKIIISIILFAVLLLGVGYASLQNITLNIEGKATAEAPLPPPITSLEQVTNANIGDYIDLGNNIINTESTSDDWRILYREGDTVYAILADRLPANQVPDSTGLDKNPEENQYGVWSDANRETLLNGLNNKTAWSVFANGITGATVTGAPTMDLLLNSYNTKNRTELKYTDHPTLDNTTEDYNLYVPDKIDRNKGYWIAMPYEGDSSNLWFVYYDGGIHWYVGYNFSSDFSARPVVALPTSTKSELVDGVWKPEAPPAPEPTLEQVTNANIGDYIDLGNNIVKTNSTSDDWRILYVENGKVYVILADYLPNSTGYASNAGLSVYDKYYINFDSNNYNAHNDYTYAMRSDAWNGLANGFSESASGTVSMDLLLKSYNTKNNTNIKLGDILDNTTKDYDLYIPSENASGYRLRDINFNYNHTGAPVPFVMMSDGRIDWTGTEFGIRPVVELPASIKAELVDGVWKVDVPTAPEPEPEPKPTLEKVTNANIGDYIDLGNNVVKTNSTSDDWRILYVENDRVCVMLADLLPTSEETRFSGKIGSNRFYEENATIMIKNLSNISWWDYSNGISGATTYGGPTLEEIRKATQAIGYEFSNNLDNGYQIGFDGTSNGNYDLATNFIFTSDSYALREGEPANNKMWEVLGGMRSAMVSLGNNFNNSSYGIGIRPVVYLPKTTTAELVDGVWKVIK